MQITVAIDPPHAAELAAQWIARRIRSAIRLRGAARVAVSGGTTPALMFDALAAMKLEWEFVDLFQVDERVAPDGHPDRNAEQLHDHLLRHVPIPRRNVHLMPVTDASLTRAAAAYADVVGAARLDIVHLGIGDDGHTASWPPGDPVIEAPEPVAISAEFNGWVRMTLTPPAVNAARARLVLAVGTDKAEPLAGWLLHHAGLPIQRVHRSGTALVIDRSAAALLAAS